MLFLCCGQLYVERLAKAVRKKRADAEKAAAEAQHGMGLKQAAAQGDFTYKTHLTCFLELSVQLQMHWEAFNSEDCLASQQQWVTCGSLSG